MQGKEIGGGNRQRCRQRLHLSSSSGNLVERESNTNFNSSSCKKRNPNKSSSLRPWSDLPEELLDLISKGGLSMVDFLAFGGVCRNWRSLFVACKQDFMASQAPFIVLIELQAKRICSFYNMSNGRTYKSTLPDLSGKCLIGSSAGYLIMEDSKCRFWLVNPFTRHELHFPSLPLRSDRTFIYDRVILTSLMPYPDFVLVALSILPYSLQFCRSGDAKWTVCSYADKPWVILDIAVFRGKIFVVTNKAQIGILLSIFPPDLRLLEAKSTPTLSPNLQLVTTHTQLMLVDFTPSSRVKIYWLDFRRQDWVKIENLRGHALFLGYNKCSAIINPTRWGGRSNCVYHVGSSTNKCFVYSLEGDILDTIPLVGNPNVCSMMSHCWYFPHHCYKLQNGLPPRSECFKIDYLQND